MARLILCMRRRPLLLTSSLRCTPGARMLELCPALAAPLQLCWKAPSLQASNCHGCVAGIGAGGVR